MENNITFIDTCIISQALQDNEIMKNLIRFIVENKCFCGITAKTLSELHKSNLLFNEFHKYLNVFPFFLIKPSKILISDEINKINSGVPIHVALANLRCSSVELENLTKEIVSIVDTEFPKGAKKIITDSMQDLKKNFPPKNGNKYVNSEIKTFCELLILQQLENHHPDLLAKIKKKEFNPLEFESLKSQVLIKFWKFYKSEDRKIRDSDVFDISMSSCFPYMDIIISEKNMVNDIKQIKREKFAFGNLKQVLTIKELKPAT